MTTVLYLFQAAVVFFSPIFFGWVLLRRLVHENDLLVLVPASIVVGSTTLMASMNELRYWLEMNVATWFAYKLLLAAGLFILVVTPPSRFPLQLAGGGRRWLWALVALLGTLVTGLYFGIPAAHGFLNDSWWFHYPAATLVQDLRVFPIPSIFAPDDPLYYHFGPDILAATWAYLLDTTVQQGFIVSVYLFAPSAFLLGYALILRGSRSHLAALSAASFMAVGGNLLFLRLSAARHLQGLEILDRLNSESVDGLLKLMFTPSHACGVPAVLVGILFFWRFSVRPSWSLAAILGLWLGALTLIAEWYFFVFFGAVALSLLARTLRELARHGGRRPTRGALVLRAAPLLIAIGWGFFNNTYVSGIFGHFWMHYPRAELVARARLEKGRFEQETNAAAATGIYSNVLRGLTASPSNEKLARKLTAFPIPPPPREVGTLFGNDSDYIPTPMEPWAPPALVPLGLNIHHFGMVPSWASAGASGASYVPLLGFRFIAECTPVILIGLPFGIWLSFRRNHPILHITVLLTVLAILPPIVLDWGYRSTDFLRFFTAAFSFSALLLGWFVGFLWARGGPAPRATAVAVCACALVNPFVIGLLGLRSSTFDAVQKVNQSAGSLKQAAVDEKMALEGGALSSEVQKTDGAGGTSRPKAGSGERTGRMLSAAQKREIAFGNLAEGARRYLYPLTLGRDRAIVIVPLDETPPTEVFPEWLKLATLTHVLLPIGWYWNDSYYAAYYRKAVTTLSPASVAALDARWIIVSNLFESPPDEVMQALHDPQRFAVAQSFVNGSYNLLVYRVLPYGVPPAGEPKE
jgi:hypothetical protein